MVSRIMNNNTCTVWVIRGLRSGDGVRHWPSNFFMSLKPPEDLTSKTCISSGLIREKVDGNKAFRCEGCNLHIESDVNDA